MKDTQDQNAFWFLSVEDNVLAMLHAAQSVSDVIAFPPQSGIAGEPLTAGFKIVDVTFSLLFAPAFEREVGDIGEVRLRPAGKTKYRHASA